MKNSIQQVADAFPNLRTEFMAQGDGMNIYIANKFIITAWFGIKSCKWCNSRTGEWTYFKSYLTAPEEMIGIVNLLLAQEESKKKPEPKKQQTTVTAELTEKGTQACIEHIKRKLQKMENTKPNAVALVMLKTLTLELEQYL